jgi:hypothetical protein
MHLPGDPLITRRSQVQILPPPPIGPGHGTCQDQGRFAWLLSGAVALGLLALIPTTRALVDAERLAVVYQPVSASMAGGAGAALVAGWIRPAPWLLALLLVAILSVLWFFAVNRFLRADAWGEEQSHPN